MGVVPSIATVASRIEALLADKGYTELHAICVGKKRNGLSYESAEDVFHDTFLHMGSVEPPTSSRPSTYFVTAYRNGVVSRARYETYRNHLSLDDSVSIDGETRVSLLPDTRASSPADIAEQHELVARINACLSRELPLDEQIFRLRVEESMTYSEISQTLGVTERVAVSHCERTLQRVQTALAPLLREARE